MPNNVQISPNEAKEHSFCLLGKSPGHSDVDVEVTPSDIVE